MSKEILKASNDLIFKLIFGDYKNIDILTGFLKSVLDLPKSEYSKIEIIDPSSRIENIDDKTVVLDVKLHTTSGKIIDIEIQTASVAQMKSRIIYYTSKMITEQIGKGDEYNLKKVISIVITDYKLIKENEEYHNKYHLFDKKTGSRFSDIIEINTLELPKLPKETDNTELWNWLKFLQAEREEELNMLKEKSPEIEKAVGVLKELSEDERTKLLYEAREKARRDERARISGALEQGRQEGIKEGIKEGRQEGIKEGRQEGIKEGMEKGIKKIAINLYESNMPIEQIIKFTGLTREEIERLIAEI